MALNIAAPFKRAGAFPVDEALVMTKAEMLAVNDNTMPASYFAICPDDGQFYLYGKENTPDTETGKYRVLEGGGAEDYEALTNKPVLNNVTIQGEKESQDYKLTLSVQDIERILYLD